MSEKLASVRPFALLHGRPAEIDCSITSSSQSWRFHLLQVRATRAIDASFQHSSKTVLRASFDSVLSCAQNVIENNRIVLALVKDLPELESQPWIPVQQHAADWL